MPLFDQIGDIFDPIISGLISAAHFAQVIDQKSRIDELNETLLQTIIGKIPGNKIVNLPDSTYRGREQRGNCLANS